MRQLLGILCLLFAIVATPLFASAQVPAKETETTSKALRANGAYIRGVTALGTQDYPTALHALGEAVRLQPDNAVYRSMLAEAKKLANRGKQNASGRTP